MNRWLVNVSRIIHRLSIRYVVDLLLIKNSLNSKAIPPTVVKIQYNALTCEDDYETRKSSFLNHFPHQKKRAKIPNQESRGAERGLPAEMVVDDVHNRCVAWLYIHPSVSQPALYASMLAWLSAR